MCREWLRRGEGGAKARELAGLGWARELFGARVDLAGLPPPTAWKGAAAQQAAARGAGVGGGAGLVAAELT